MADDDVDEASKSVGVPGSVLTVADGAENADWDFEVAVEDSFDCAAPNTKPLLVCKFSGFVSFFSTTFGSGLGTFSFAVSVAFSSGFVTGFCSAVFVRPT